MIALVDDLMEMARRLADEAGAFLRDERPSDLKVSLKSSPTDVVTEMDRASEELLARRILEARPGDGILGEEGGERMGTSGVRWIVDPLDGTTNYLYGIPLWSVSVAAELDGIVVAGAVSAPALGLAYAAGLDRGAHERSARGTRRLAASGRCGPASRTPIASSRMRPSAGGSSLRLRRWPLP